MERKVAKKFRKRDIFEYTRGDKQRECVNKTKREREEVNRQKERNRDIEMETQSWMNI
jgi:hypothetical protein